MAKTGELVLQFRDVGAGDVPQVGGKNASLGEMIRHLAPQGVSIPDGFIVTADAYRYFLKIRKLDVFIKSALRGLDTRNLKDLARRGHSIREAIQRSELPADLKSEILKFYRRLEKQYRRNVDVAVRSSATAEDLPDASFAGEHETYLNIRGGERVLRAVRLAMASLFTDRAISYRVDKGFDHFKVALSVGVQKMVRSDRGASGVMFTLDTESGFRDVVLINGSWGLGEMIVKGEVTPDEFLVAKKILLVGGRLKPIIGKKIGRKDKKMIYAASAGIKSTKIVNTSNAERETFVLSDAEILKLARWGALIEDHYSSRNKRWMPMDMEWAKDGLTGKLYIVQARPETVHAARDFSKIKEYALQASNAKSRGSKVIVRGASVGNKVAVGKARIILDVKRASEFRGGEVLVTGMTDPDWEPIMKIAAAIVTDKGGRTSHAAIVSRELGIPCIVGAEDATRKIRTGQMITVDTTSSEGIVFEGALKFKIREHDVRKFPKPRTEIMMNIATPDTAFEKSFLPNQGVGLAREEFIIASDIGIHPLALINWNSLPTALKIEISRKTLGWRDKKKFYIDNLAYGIAKIGTAFYPQPVIVRFSDFKTNEYRTLLGGEAYEPEEENPMIGWRGASRYYDPKFKEAFGLECQALKKACEEIGLTNVIPMVPFCRTPEEGRKVLQVMKEYGLDVRAGRRTNQRKSASMKVYVMCEIPSNVLLADEFLKIFDGMSIGSNDLAQLALGLDRDSGIVTHIGNENDETVKILIREVVKKCLARGKYIGICGQGPSDYPEFAEFLVSIGIESISLNPDSIIPTTLQIYKKEKSLRK